MAVGAGVLSGVGDGVLPGVGVAAGGSSRRRRCARVWRAAGQTGKAQAALAQSWAEYNAVLAGLSPAQQAQSRQEIPDHRALLADATSFLAGR
ncbi:MAG: hypothetical protein KatS3mg050_1675 [Litorilinea sp.]|nr:MAG: hypothetical protein KatS3mg050_1675 [Litorilinea sp.]